MHLTLGASSCRSPSARWCGRSLWFVVVTPPAAIVPIVIVVGLILAGGLYFLFLLFFRRDLLETEPEEVKVFQH